MIWRVVSLASAVCFLCVSPRLTAQAHGYHLELSDGASGFVTLVNDSSKTIEAFHMKASCEDERTSRLGASTSLDYDMLWTPSRFAGAARGHDGRPVGPPQPDVIGPGQRMQSSANIPQSIGRVWHPEVDAVIYSDGSYDGSNDGVRSLQIWRDGLAEELQYWSAKLHQSPTPLDPYAIATEAQRRADSYMGQPEGILNDYESAKRQVALSLAIQAGGNLSVDELRRRQVDLIDRWAKKLDDDAAFKKMQLVFPLPQAVITSTTRATAGITAQQ